MISICIRKYMEKAMAPQSSTLAWKIPWAEEPGRLQSMGSWLSDFTFTFHFHALEKEMATCREPPREIPPMTKVMRREPDRQRRIRPQGTPSICLSIYPKTRICLSYYFVPFTNSSDINRGLPFSGKSQLRALVNKSPGHDRSVSIQTPQMAF